jgi:hypothetical protein
VCLGSTDKNLSRLPVGAAAGDADRFAEAEPSTRRVGCPVVLVAVAKLVAILAARGYRLFERSLMEH